MKRSRVGRAIQLPLKLDQSIKLASHSKVQLARSNLNIQTLHEDSSRLSRKSNESNAHKITNVHPNEIRIEKHHHIIQENKQFTVEQFALIHSGQPSGDSRLRDPAPLKRENNIVDTRSIQKTKVIMMENDDIKITLANDEVNEVMGNLQTQVISDANVAESFQDFQQFPPWYQRLSDELTSFLESRLMVDVQLMGDDGDTVPAHQLILAHVSPYLRQLLSMAKADCQEDILTIVLPDTKTKYVRSLVYSVYTGRLPKSCECLRQMLSLVHLLGLDLGSFVADESSCDRKDNYVLNHMQSKDSQQLDLSMPTSNAFEESIDLEVSQAETEEVLSDQDSNGRVETDACEPQELEEHCDISEQQIIDSHQPDEQPQRFVVSEHCDEDDEEPVRLEIDQPPSLDETDLATDKEEDDEEEDVEEDFDEEGSVIEQNIQLVQTELGEIIILSCHSEDISATESAESEEQARMLADVLCCICNKTANSHLVLAEDGTSMYTCCKCGLDTATSNTTSRTQITSFHQHMINHKTATAASPIAAANDEVDAAVPVASSGQSPSIKYEPADKPCPMCLKPRRDHKNREIDKLSKGNHKGNLYKCCHCTASRLTAKKFFSHMENHVAKKHVCSQCGKGYSYKHLLEEHVWKVHGDGQDEWIVCPYINCEYKARYKQTLSTHINEHHKGIQRKAPQGNKKMVCPTCKKVLKQWYYNQHHSKTCGAQAPKGYKCEVCGKEGFINSTTLNNHKRIKHSSDRPHNCEYCPARFATSMSLSSHRASKHGLNARGEKVVKKMFPCTLCTKVLTTSIKLKQHIEVIHEGRRDFGCRYCAKRFTSKSNQKIHEGSQHTGVLPYNCDQCEKSFSRKSQLRSHLAQIHGIHVDVSGIEPAKSFKGLDSFGGGGGGGVQVMEGALGVGSEEVMDRDDSNFYVVNGLDTVHDVQVCQVGDVIIPMECLVEEDASVV